MKLLSFGWHEVVLEWPGFCRMIDTYLGGRTRGFAAWPLMILRNRALLEHKVLLNHERIHFAQERDLLVAGMFLIYVLETLWARLVLRMDARTAYFWLSAEQEV